MPWGVDGMDGPPCGRDWATSLRLIMSGDARGVKLTGATTRVALQSVFVTTWSVPHGGMMDSRPARE